MTLLAAAVHTVITSTTHHPCGTPRADHRHGDPTTCPECLGSLSLYRRRAQPWQGGRVIVCPACGDQVSESILAREPNGSQTVVCSLDCRRIWEYR